MNVNSANNAAFGLLAYDVIHKGLRALSRTGARLWKVEV